METVPASRRFLAGRIKIFRSLIAHSPATFFQSEFGNCILLTVILLVMSIINTSWLYGRIGLLDTWVYVGYFFHYSDPTFGNWYYKVARLSWIIPGSIAYHIFQPSVANYLLHIGYLA